MGFPMIQVFMIAARQVSKPIADAVLRYGKEHPTFRNRLLIPVGKKLVRLTTRLRMKRLGLGEPVNQASVSESAALEQASDFVQQLVLFTYSVGVFAGYYFYTKISTPESIKVEDFEQLRKDHDSDIKLLKDRVEDLEETIRKMQSTMKTAPSKSEKDRGTEDKKTAVIQRISAAPVDSATNCKINGSEYLIVQRGTSIGIELTAKWHSRREKLRFRSTIRKNVTGFEYYLKEATSLIIRN